MYTTTYASSVVAAVLLVAGCTSTPVPAPAPSETTAGASEIAPVDIVMAGMKAAFVDFDEVGVIRWFAEDYIQHNPAMPTGRAPILGFLPALRESGLAAEVHRVLSEGDLVALHSTYRNAQLFGGETLVAFDVFRVEDGQIAEHWDNLIPLVPAAETASGRSQTDGPTEVTDRARTADNRTLVQGFVPDVLQGAAPGRLTDYVSTERYDQHNPAVADGLDGLGAALAAMAEAGQAMSYARTPLIVAEGNFVLTASEGALGDTPTAFYDLFRIDEGRIVEHWDVIAAIPSEMAHDNGKF
ncbi:MAG: nuclear transport factor 2 family protein [Myxococcota bacterium]